MRGVTEALEMVDLAAHLPVESEQEPSPFPLHCLPPAALAMAESICHLKRIPASMAGPCVLGIIAASIGAGLEVQSAPDRTSRANLFILLSAESGSGKSEVIRLVAAPFYEYEHEILDRWKTNILPGAKAEEEILKAEIGRLRRDAPGAEGGKKREDIQAQMQIKMAALSAAAEAMHAPVLCVEDATTEKLALLLSRLRETLFSISSDAGAVINNLLGRYSKGDRTDETIYLKAWTGEHVKVDRVLRESVSLERPCLAALWCVQPDKVDALLSVQALSDGGFLPRVLVCHTGCQMREIDEGAAQTGIAKEISEAWRASVRELIECFRLAAGTAAIVQPEPEAARLLIDHYNAIVRRCRSGELRDVQSFVARWTEQAWRIALCLHAGLWGRGAGATALAAETAAAAIQIADWFSGQQLAILQKSRSEKSLSRLEKLRGLIEHFGGEARLRDLAKNNGFEPGEVRRLAADFPAQLVIEKRETGGRPTEIVLLPGAARNAAA